MTECVRTGEYELVIKRSRFIAYSYRIESRDEVKPIIDALKKQHPEARHVCYGFIADEKGDDFGYDDNGEPSGTAGKPIYSAVASSGAKKSLVAVVRYFGGIKLGAGGLTRAYRQSAAELIESVGLAKIEQTDVYEITCTNDDYKRLSAVFRGEKCVVEKISYNNGVSCTVLAPAGFDMSGALGGTTATSVKTGQRYKEV
ncbi:MAG: YigZ family protein [Clostridiales bacterium]|nr:YigZ family protein [Clostridiales bacterium]